MYHHLENPVLEQFSSPMAGVETWNILSSEDFTCNPSKMMGEHPLIISDNHVDHSNYMTMKAQGLEEVLGSTPVGQFIFQDGGEMIVEHNVEVGNDDPQGDIILVPNTAFKQEDIVVDGEVIVGSNVESEVVIDDHLDSDRFVIGPTIDMTTDHIDDSFEDTKLIIDTTEYECLDETPSVGYDCGECGIFMKDRASLKKHIRSEHSHLVKKSRKNGLKTEYIIPGKRYTCPSCSYTTQRRDKLDRHMQKHVLLDGVHPCGKKRHKPDMLPQRHRHNAEEYRCSLCPYVCTVFKAFKKHRKVHTPGNHTFTLKLSCKICGKDRSTESDMLKHMRKHMNGKQFLCDLCAFSSVQLKKIIQHRRMHTGEKPHLCPHCSYRSARRDNLRSHVRRMHKRENMYIDTFNPNGESPD